MPRMARTRIGALGAFSRALLGSFPEGWATEYDMRIYVLREVALDAAIGSDDGTLRAEMQADAEYIDSMELDPASAAARDLDDPHMFRDAMSGMLEQIAPIEAALDRAVETGSAAAFVYRS